MFGVVYDFYLTRGRLWSPWGAFSFRIGYSLVIDLRNSFPEGEFFWGGGGILSVSSSESIETAVLSCVPVLVLLALSASALAFSNFLSLLVALALTFAFMPGLAARG